MDSPNSDSDGAPFFESSEGGGSSIEDINMEAQCENFRGLDYEGYENVSEQPARATVSSGSPSRLPDLSSIIARENERSKRKKGVKKIKKNEYDKIIDDLQKYGERHGFIDHYLELIWDLVSNQNSALNCAQRRRMIFLMLPDQLVGHKVINKILYWLKEAKGCKPTVLTAVYQLLNVYFDNRLDDDSEIISTNTVNCILTARTEKYIIPWKTRLIRNIVTPEILTLISINALKKLLKTTGIKKTQRDDIYATLGLCNHMRPDLFSNDDLPAWKIRALNFPEDVCKRFYDAKLRIQNERPTHHPLADRIFPEFLPDCNASSARKTILSDMLACLDSDEKTASLAMNPVLLHVFEEWLKPMLNYRFHYFSGILSMADQARYNFMLLKIAHITKVRQEGLKAVNEWVVNFLCNWDFWIFDAVFISLLAFVRPEDVLQCRDMLEMKLLKQFRNPPFPEARVTIWKTLENWFFGWTEAETIEEDGGLPSNLEIILNVDVDSRKWLLKLMSKCVEVSMYSIDGPEDDKAQNNIRIHFSNFIYALLEVRNQIDFQKEETRDVVEALKSNLLVLEELSETIPALGLD